MHELSQVLDGQQRLTDSQQGRSFKVVACVVLAALRFKLVSSTDDARAMTVAPAGALRDIHDPNPGPRDARALVAHFARVLPGDVEVDGVFSLGEE